ncbi:MAG TPA: amidohydrolase family protein [Actinomycetota bacterium]
MSAVDAHHHLWDPRTRDYPWMAGPAFDPIRRPYGLDDLRARTAAAGIGRTVLVQTVADSSETEEFLKLAAASDGLVAGVVGWVDLEAPDVAGALERLRSLPGGERLVGVRHQVQDEPDPDWLGRPQVRRGLRAVAEAGLVYDLLVLVPQLDSAVAAARELPQGRFVLDHAAKPPIASGAMEPWAGGIGQLARLPNVACKLSGLVTEARWDDWDAAGIRPYAEHVLAAFGPGRVLFGSDWPVCELAASYEAVHRLAGELLEGLAPDERELVMGGSAEAAYRLT